MHGIEEFTLQPRNSSEFGLILVVSDKNMLEDVFLTTFRTRSFAGSCVLLSIPSYSSLFPYIPFNSHRKLPALKIERILQLYFQSLRHL